MVRPSIWGGCQYAGHGIQGIRARDDGREGQQKKGGRGDARLGTLVSALLPQSALMRAHVQTVIRQESTDVVGDGCGNLVDGLQLLEPVLRGRQTEGGRLVHQAELGIDIVLLLLLAERVPRLALQFVGLGAFFGRGRRSRSWLSLRNGDRGRRRRCDWSRRANSWTIADRTSIYGENASRKGD